MDNLENQIVNGSQPNVNGKFSTPQSSIQIVSLMSAKTGQSGAMSKMHRAVEKINQTLRIMNKINTENEVMEKDIAEKLENQSEIITKIEETKKDDIHEKASLFLSEFDDEWKDFIEYRAKHLPELPKIEVHDQHGGHSGHAGHGGHGHEHKRKLITSSPL